MIERTKTGKVIFESRDERGTILSAKREPYWLRKPPTPELLRPRTLDVTREPGNARFVHGTAVA